MIGSARGGMGKMIAILDEVDREGFTEGCHLSKDLIWGK
jgi:hypothetical protein